MRNIFNKEQDEEKKEGMEGWGKGEEEEQQQKDKCVVPVVVV